MVGSAVLGAIAGTANRVVRGYFNYHALPRNLIRLGSCRYAVYGGKPSNVAASVIGFNGHATDALSLYTKTQKCTSLS